VAVENGEKGIAIPDVDLSNGGIFHVFAPTCVP
jgi:hypothetical protein